MSSIRSTITVAGMTCGHCVSAVTSELEAVDGITGVEIDLDSGAVTYEADRPVDPEAIAQAVDEAGYEVVVDA